MARRNKPPRPAVPQVTYPELLRTEPLTRIPPVMGVIGGVLSFVVFASAITQGLCWLYWLVLGGPGSFADTYRSLIRYEQPFGLIATHLGLAVLIPISIGLVRLLHRAPATALLSVEGRVRWRWFWITLGVSAVVLNLVLALNTLVASGTLNLVPTPQAGFGWFLLCILLTSPLQAAAEEVFFRGYLMQALGALGARPWFTVVASALTFAAFHGTQNLPLFLDRFGFGLVAGVLVWRTGGLEAAVAAHVVNNVCAFTYAALSSSVAQVKAIQQVGWIEAAWDVGGFAVYTLVALWLARRLGVSESGPAPLIGAVGGAASGRTR